MDSQSQLGNVQWDDEKYGTLPQQGLTAIEGLGQGLAGPVATGAEALLSKAGVPGLTPQDQALRAETNPITYHGAQIAGFGAGALSGMGEAALLGKAGEAAATASGLTGATLTSRLALQGIKTGTEIAALQAGDELSKAINQDPNQTLGSAAINIGLAGLLGGTGGVALGGVSDLWRKGTEAADDFINGAKASVAERQALEAGEAIAGPSGPFTGRWAPGWAPGRAEVEPSTSEALGRKFGHWMFDKGTEAAAKGVGESLGASIGAIGGSLVGHPLFGGYVGEKTLTPLISSIAKPLLENVTDGPALKATLDYLSNAIKGQSLLTNAVGNVFKGTEVLAKNLLPNEKSRSDLQKSLDSLENPENMLAVGGQLGHYMLPHQTAAAGLAASAQNYFNAIKPKVNPATPFQAAPPPQPAAAAAYNRALDLAQQPLLALQHVKNGTLLPQDVGMLQALYPGLHKTMGDKLTQEMIKQQAEGQHIPYHIRVGLQNLMGSTPMDGTLAQPVRMAIIKSQAQQQTNNQARGGPHKGATAQTQKTINKTGELYQTLAQSREDRAQR